MGLPVAATPVGGIPKVLRDGENGFLLEPGNPPAMARKLIEILSKPEAAHRAGQAARETILAEYDIERVWPVYLQAIRRAVAEARGDTRGIQDGSATLSEIAAAAGREEEQPPRGLAKGQQ
jgi:glycosyltransferase involved in cell wall biosynthesis